MFVYFQDMDNLLVSNKFIEEWNINAKTPQISKKVDFLLLCLISIIYFCFKLSILNEKQNFSAISANWQIICS